MKEIRVVKIISTKQIVINAGANDGIKTSDKIEIVDKNVSDPIIDPDTGENLGSLDVVKGTAIVSRVYPHMSIAEAPWKSLNGYSSNIRAAMNAGSLASSLSLGNRYIQSDLNVDPEEITGLPTKSNSPIKIGDYVVVVNK